MADTRELVSVGVDIGTTTTQIIFSQLSLKDVTRAGQIPRIDITDRKVLYESPIVFTPLLDEETIDAESVARILRQEYQRAGVRPEQVETGAVIITGETAKKKNADLILKTIAGLAGDFVCTVAGPNVESLIAGKGSGAAAYSRQHFTTVVSVDIGGGSANSAVFSQGNMIASAAMNFGGRILEIEHASGRVRHLARPALAICQYLGIQLKPGDTPSLELLQSITDCMADMTVELIEGSASPLALDLYLTPPTPVSGKGKTLMISGGIGYYIHEPITIHSVADLTIHDDIGPLLAQSIRQHPILKAYPAERPAETLRATVLGASSQTVTLSGSTIWAEEDILPLKNVPVIRPEIGGMPYNPDELARQVLAALRRWDLNLASDSFAVSLELDLILDYHSLVQICQGLVTFSSSLAPGRPLIVIIKRDYAQAVGQTIKSILGPRPLLVIDQVGLEEGDYIDIGRPLMDGRVVPLSVKTLVFYH